MLHDQRRRLWWRLGWRLLKLSITELRIGLGRLDWYPRRGGHKSYQLTYPKWPKYHFFGIQVTMMTFWGKNHGDIQNWARGAVLVSSWRPGAKTGLFLNIPILRVCFYLVGNLLPLFNNFSVLWWNTVEIHQNNANNVRNCHMKSI